MLSLLHLLPRKHRFPSLLVSFQPFLRLSDHVLTVLEEKSHAESSGAVHDHDQVAEILSSDLTQNRTDILAEVQEFRAHAVQAAASATRLMKLLDTFEKSSKISHTPKVKARETAGPPSVASPSTSKPPVQSGPAVLVENRQLSSVGKGKRKAEEPVVNARRSARHTVSNLDGTDGKSSSNPPLYQHPKRSKVKSEHTDFLPSPERAAKRQHTASSSRGGTPRRRGHGGRMK